VYKTLNTKNKLNNSLYEVGRSCISEVRNRSESSSDDLQLPDNQKHQWGLNRTRQADSPVISEYTNLKKIGGGEGKRQYCARQSKVCAAHKKGS
jgi:hypothetical protein